MANHLRTKNHEADYDKYLTMKNYTDLSLTQSKNVEPEESFNMQYMNQDHKEIETTKLRYNISKI